MTNVLKRAILREKFNIDVEIWPIQSVQDGVWIRAGYRYVISRWDENNHLTMREYSPLDAEKYFQNYEDAEDAALNYIDEYVAKV